MASSHLPNVGDTFLGTWLIEGEVGKGGFSVVYRAADPSGRVGALKVLLPKDRGQGPRPTYDGDLADRFVREARLLAQLDSPYTIRMWDHGESSEGLLYMVFEFIDGRMLFDEIKGFGALAPDRVIHILRQTLIALESAHAMGILHRDIKPNNIMLYERDGDPDRVKLVDFGIAKMFGGEDAVPGNDLTAAGLLVGTPRYMSPEQLKMSELTPASDLYSLGLCAIEMLSGRKCIPGKDRLKIVEAQLRPEQIMLPDDVVAPHDLVAIVHRLTRKPAAQRYPSATDVLRDLEDLAGDPGATGDTVYQSVPAGLDELRAAAKARNSMAAADASDSSMHRVNASALDALIAGAGGEASEVDPFDATIAGGELPTMMLERDAEFAAARQSVNNDETINPYVDGMTVDLPRPDASGERVPVDPYGSGQFGAPPQPQQNPYGSGQYQDPYGSGAYGSGQFQAPQQQPPPQDPYGSGAYGSGQFAAPQPGPYGSGQYQAPQPGPYGSGQHQAPQPGPYGSGQYQAPQPGPYGSGQYPAPQQPDPYGSGQYPAQQDYSQGGHGQPPVDQPPGPRGSLGERLGLASLNADDKLSLGASFLVPGVGQVIAGQVNKGLILTGLLLAAMLFTMGIAWLLLMPLAIFDTLLLVRAQKYRDVGPYEMFPDLRDVL